MIFVRINSHNFIKLPKPKHNPKPKPKPKPNPKSKPNPKPNLFIK